MARTDADWAWLAAELLRRLAERRPLVHHVSNLVTLQAVANATLAVGALPVMGFAPEEAAELAGQAACVVINLGTPTPLSVDGALAAARAAADRGVPVVLDPVGVGASAFRRQAVRRVLEVARCVVIRANPAEAALLAGVGRPAGWVQRGVESVPDPAGAAAAQQRQAVQRWLARELVRPPVSVAAVTGPVDVVAGGEGTLAIANGDPLFEVITGAGCMATAVVAAFVSVSRADERLEAAACALAVFGAAGERAARRSAGPGSFGAALFDELHGAFRAARAGEVPLGLRIREL